MAKKLKQSVVLDEKLESLTTPEMSELRGEVERLKAQVAQLQLSQMVDDINKIKIQLAQMSFSEFQVHELLARQFGFKASRM